MRGYGNLQATTGSMSGINTELCATRASVLWAHGGKLRRSTPAMRGPNNGLVDRVHKVIKHAREGEDSAQDGTALRQEVPKALPASCDFHLERGEVVTCPEAGGDHVVAPAAVNGLHVLSDP